jgi:cytochrome P450
MTIRIICAQLGFTEFDTDSISRWSHAVVQQISKMQSREDMLKHAKDICDLQNFLIAQIRDRQANPRDDLISDLVHARTDDSEQPTLTFEEAVSLVRATLIAGNETTATALGNLLYVLATEPELAQQLYESASSNDDRLLNRFVEELLRYEPPVRGLSRMTTREVELGGAKLPANAPMLLLYASANDDETEFACPRNFDVNRGTLGRHVAFGGGVHRCIGAALARMEIKVAAREFIMRLKDIKVAIPLDQIKYQPTVATRSMVSLPLTFTQRT